jgi:hypothetical protein
MTQVVAERSADEFSVKEMFLDSKMGSASARATRQKREPQLRKRCAASQPGFASTLSIQPLCLLQAMTLGNALVPGKCRYP